jgi:hypothetical protein
MSYRPSGAFDRTQPSAIAGERVRRGAYGLEIKGLGSPELLNPLPAGLGWPAVRVARKAHASLARRESSAPEEERTEIALLGGDRVIVDRGASSATLLTASDGDDGRMAHPFLAVVGALFGWWLGHDLFHGGAVAIGGKSWAIIGEQGAGKSSLLAQLAATGHTVMADDLVVIDEGCVLAGPRCIDLREPAIGLVETPKPTHFVRAGERHRLVLGSSPPAVPLAGWIFLSWGDRFRARPLAPRERLSRLLAERCAGKRLLELVHLPGWDLERPHRSGSIPAAGELVAHLAAGGGR